MASITSLPAAGSVAAGDELAINQSGTDRRVTADKFLLAGVANGAPLVLGRTDLTIAAGAVTVTRSLHRIDTEAGAAADDLDTINGGVDGQILIIMTVSNVRDVVIRHGVGNIYLNAAANFTLLGTASKLMLISVTGSWFEIGHGSNV